MTVTEFLKRSLRSIHFPILLKPRRAAHGTAIHKVILVREPSIRFDLSGAFNNYPFEVAVGHLVQKHIGEMRLLDALQLPDTDLAT